MRADDGAAMLGEVALVDGDSRVGRTGLIFLNTLFDENATCHIAYGAGILEAIDGRRRALERGRARGARLQQLDDPHRLHDRRARGRGRRDRAGGTAVPILRGDAWQLT